MVPAGEKASQECIACARGIDDGNPVRFQTEVAEGNFDIWVKGRFDLRGCGLPTMTSSLLLFAG